MRWLTGLLLVVLLPAGPASGVDHNNLDAERPLSFDDAEPIAYRERAVEGGLVLRDPRGRSLGLKAHTEFLYGLAMNSHVSLGLSPAIGGRADSERTGPDLGDLSVGAFHNFNREYNGTPAFALRGDLSLPTGRDSRGVGVRLRGIASRRVGQYGRLHVNLDLKFETDARRGEREFQPGLILGYSRPVGYPRRFDRTLIAEVGVQAGPRSGTGPVILTGVGLRQQVTPRSVLDLGLGSDLAGSGGVPRDTIRLIAGYSTAF